MEFHHTLGCSDSWGAFRLADSDGFSGDVANGFLNGRVSWGGGDSLLGGLLSGDGSICLGLLSSLWELLLLVNRLGSILVLLASGLRQRAGELSEDGTALLRSGRSLFLLGLLGLGLSLGLSLSVESRNSCFGGLNWSRLCGSRSSSRSLLNLWCGIRLGFSSLIVSSWRLGSLLGAEELAK